MKTPLIGILGGMGPRSTSPFLESVLDEYVKKNQPKTEGEFPHIIIYSLPAPFVIGGEDDHELLSNIVCEGLKKLESIGVDFIVIPCNTVHRYFEDFIKCVSIPILNIIEETVKVINTKDPISILATGSTLDSKLYQIQLVKKGLDHLNGGILQPDIDEYITLVKDNPNDIELDKIWDRILTYHFNMGCNNIIIGCTDIMIKENEKNKLNNYFISSEILAKATIDFYNKLIKEN